MVQKEILVSVIDDDESVRRAFQILLRSAGFTSHACSSAEEFLECPSLDDSSVVILDMRMPGMTGLDFLKKLASLKKRIPVIAVSAYDDRQTRDLARELGALVFFRKPVDDQALLDAISWAIQGAEKKEMG
jgi:FixJ family two-component response regulator